MNNCKRQKFRYPEIEETLRGEILAGVFPEGSFLPGEFELAHRFHSGRTTVRKALSLLTKQNFLRKINGAGTCVIPEAERLALPRRLAKLRIILPQHREELDHFDREIIAGATAYARLHDCETEIAVDEFNAEKLLHDHRAFLHDGLLWSRLTKEAEKKVLFLRDAQVPQVVIARDLPEVAGILFDSARSLEDAVQMFSATCHKHLLFFDLQTNRNIVNARYADFAESCKKYGCEALHLPFPPFPEEAGLTEAVNTLSAFWREHPQIDGILCAAYSASRQFPAAVFQAAERLKLRIPGDCSLLVVTEGYAQSSARLRIPLRAMGTAAAEILVQAAEKHLIPKEKRLIPGELLWGRTFAVPESGKQCPVN